MTLHTDDFLYIDSYDSLKEICKNLVHEEFIAIDTEFIRKNTYFPKCCLIQFATPNYIGVIDPILISDISIFNESVSKITKIFHDAKQDIECLNSFGKIDYSTIFDTQTAELFLDFYNSRPSYKLVVKKYLDISISKALTTSDWSKRPLNTELIKYALNDVIYLAKIFPKQIEKLQYLNRIKAYEDFLYNDLYNYIYRDSSRKNSLSLKDNILAWQQNLAKEKNVNLQSVLSKLAISELIKRRPHTLEEFYSSQSYSIIKMKENYAKELVKIINESNDEEYYEKKSVKSDIHAICKILLNVNANKNSISPIVIANTKELDDFINTKNIESKTDLQKEIFFNDAILLLNGHLNITIKDNEILFIKS